MSFSFLYLFFAFLVSATVHKMASEYFIKRSLTNKLKRLRPPTGLGNLHIGKLPNFITQKANVAIRIWSSRFKNLSIVSEEEKRKLRSAGIYRTGVHSYLKLIKVGTGISLPIVLIPASKIIYPDAGTQIDILSSMVLFMIGYKVVDFYLVYRSKVRLEEADRFFSDFLQLLIIAMTAGLSLEASLRRASVQIKRQSLVLHQEAEILLVDLSLRGDRSKAYSLFGDRLKSDYFRNLSVIMQQTERQGVSAVSALRSLAASQSQERFSKMEEKVGRLGVLMTLPLIVFVFPLLFCIIIVPSVFL